MAFARNITVSEFLERLVIRESKLKRGTIHLAKLEKEMGELK